MQALYAQLLVGLINGSFYALLSLGLAVIFGMLNIINFAHGALYMMGAFCAYFLLHLTGIGYWWALLIAPIVVGIFGMILERTMLQWLAGLDHLYGLLLTFGLALVIEQALRIVFGAAPLAFSIPPELRGQLFIGDFVYPRYRLIIFAIAIAAVTATWFIVYRTSFGRVVRAGVQNPDVVGALGISLAPYMTAIAALGVGLAGLAGVLLAPIAGVHPAMGAEILTAAFVVVVIGGLGSFWGVIAAAMLVGVVRGITIYFNPSWGEASMYLLMALVLLIRPRGLLGERIMKFE